MQKKFYLPLLYFPNRGEKFSFLWKFFNQWDFEKKSNSIFRLFCDWNRVMSRQWCWKNSIDLYCILQIGEKTIFFLWKFFNQSDFEKKSNSIFRLFCDWNRVMSRQWCWKNSIDLCCILRIGEKKFFFYQNFSTNEISRKNQIELIDYFVIGIERRVDSDAEKILLIFVVFSKSGRKYFFFFKIFQPIGFRKKMELSYSVILSLESGDEWTLMLKKLYLPLLYSPNRGENIFFSSKFFSQSDLEKNWNSVIRLFCDWNRAKSRQWCWKNSIDLCCILQIGEKIFFFFKIFQPIGFRKKMELSYSIILSLESRDEWTLMLKKLYLPLLYSPNRGENIFFSSKFFSQSDLEKNWNSVIRLFCDWNRAKSRQWCWKNSIDLCCILQIGEKNFFFYENFSTNEILRKNQIQFFDYFVIGIERRVDSDAEKILLIFVVFSKSGRKYFFFFKIFQPIGFRKKMELSYSIILSLESSEESTVMLKKFYWSLLYSPNRGEKFFFLWKFFNQWDFEKKSNSIFRLFCDWNPAMSRQWCWKNSIDLCCILQIGEKKFFFYQNFSTNEISRKNQIELIDYFVIGIERRVDSDAEKILLIFVVFSKSGRKIFFSMKIFQPMRFWEKIKFNFSIILWLESSDESTVMLKKFYWSLLYSPNRGEKIFFLSKFFNQWDFEKKSNWINRLFCDWNRAKSRQWCWKNSIDLCCILQIGEKIFFFLQNFSANRISKKNGSQLFDYFVIGIERWVNTDAEKIVFAFVVFSKSGRKYFFFFKIFQPIRFREKLELSYSIILWLESRDEWTLMLKKFHWPLLYSPNRWEKIFVWIKIFQAIRIWEEIKLNNSIIFLLE